MTEHMVFAARVFAGFMILCTLSSFAAEGTLGPWRKGDFIYTDQLADDRPDEASRRTVKDYFKPIVPDRFFLGENKKLGFRISPRNERWAGILITSPDGKPVALPKLRNMGSYKVEVRNAAAKETTGSQKERRGSRLKSFVMLDSRVMYSDASRVYPRTEIVVRKDGKLLDRVTVDFSAWKLTRSKVQMKELVPSAEGKGFVRASRSDFVRDDGKRLFFWGGHENHIPTKAQADLYAEAYREAGINVMRHLGQSEMIKNPETGEIDPELLDRYHYLVYKLGQNGIYFFMSHTYGYVARAGRKNVYGYPAGKKPDTDQYLLTMTDPKVRAVQKKFWKTLLTSVNPYNGKALKDDPTVIGFELANEWGLNPRRFDYNAVDRPADTERWRKIFCNFLLKKYGTREALSDAWKVDPLFRWEDPAKGTIVIPTRFRGQRSHGGRGQSDTYVTGRYYLDGVARIASPRISDMIQCTYEVQREWATDLMDFIKNEIGVKCAVGWNGDGFHICQVPNHKANMDSPGTVTISAGYSDWDFGNQLTSRTKNLKRWNYFGYIHNRPTFSYEWGGWATMGPYQYEYILLAALMGRTYGFDGFAHHKMAACIYPVADPWYSLKVHYITPLTDRRRGAFYVARWILERSKINERRNKIIVGYPDGSAFCGGPDRKMSSPGFENWIMYQLGTEDYSFKDVYDGPADRIVIHEGRAPAGDYRKAKHAVLWCHSNTGADGKDTKAKEKWFALHGIKFKPGQKYYIDDHYFATTEDPTEYVVSHRKAEEARWAELRKINRPGRNRIEIEHDYWAAEPDSQPCELDRQLYQAFKRWGYDVPFAGSEIDKVWRAPGMLMDTTKVEFAADRDDMQLWFGQMAGKGGFKLSRLEVKTDEKQFAAALLPWDTADFKTAKALALWTIWNGEVTVKHPFPRQARIYGVNWLGVRIFEVRAKSLTGDSLTFPVARHNDIFCYEIVW